MHDAFSVLEVLNEGFFVEVIPVVDLKLLVEWLDLLSYSILGGCVNELQVRVGDIWNV